MSAIEIRRARLRDAPAMTSISQEAYAPFVPLIGRPPAPMVADHALHIANDTVFLACDIAGAVLGYAILIEADDGFWLDNIAVAPSAQGQGVGGPSCRVDRGMACAADRSVFALYQYCDGSEYRLVPATRFCRNRPSAR